MDFLALVSYRRRPLTSRYCIWVSDEHRLDDESATAPAAGSQHWWVLRCCPWFYATRLDNSNMLEISLLIQLLAVSVACRLRCTRSAAWGGHRGVYVRGAVAALRSRGHLVQRGLVGAVRGEPGAHGGGISSSAAVRPPLPARCPLPPASPAPSLSLAHWLGSACRRPFRLTTARMPSRSSARKVLLIWAASLTAPRQRRWISTDSLRSDKPADERVEGGAGSWDARCCWLWREVTGSSCRRRRTCNWTGETRSPLSGPSPSTAFQIFLYGATAPPVDAVCSTPHRELAGCIGRFKSVV
jgi:hypothetical protein